MNKLILTAAVFGLAAAAPSHGATFAFNGTFSNANRPAATGGRCPILTVTIANGPAPLFASGTSNLGAFTASQSHCLDSAPPIPVGAAAVPYYDGRFTYTFASGATLSGSYDGLLTNSGIAGTVDNLQHFLITGGTGLFADATGSFLGRGQISFLSGPPVATLTISDGVINAPGVPEAASWAMMLTGFGAIGGLLRSRRTASVAFA